MTFVVKKILHNLFKYYITADAIKIKISVLGNTNFVLANMIMIIIIVIIIITFIIIIIVIIIIIIIIINQQGNVSQNVGEMKTIMFQFNISIFTSFRRSPPPLSSTHQY